MADGVGFVFGFFALVFVQHVVAQTVHVVGDSAGWMVPQNDLTFYSDWASKNNFVVGDSLTFNFGTNMHDVLKVTKESFDACTSDNVISSVITTGPATVKLDTAGVHYYICTIGRHCLRGQKLSVTVSTTSGGAVPPSSNTPRPPPRTPPAATTPSSHDAACAPTPANSPSSSPPNGSGTPVAPTPSSSVAAMATLYVTFSAIVMSLLF